MNISQLIAVLQARWRAALAVLVTTVLGTLIVSLTLEKQYEATASVVLDFKPDPLSALAFGGMSAPQLFGHASGYLAE